MKKQKLTLKDLINTIIRWLIVIGGIAILIFLVVILPIMIINSDLPDWLKFLLLNNK